MIQTLIHERQNRRNNAVSEVSEKWGQTQTITGPIVSIPYNEFYNTENGGQSSKISYAHILPDEIKIEGVIMPETRTRGIYEVVLYSCDLRFEANFTIPELNDLKINNADIMWNNAVVNVGLSDMKGIQELIQFTINKHKYIANPGIETTDVVPSGISTLYEKINPGAKVDFSASIELNGSSELNFTPVGKESFISINSNWISPSFIGNYIPTDHNINEDGFSAAWKVLHLNRNYPQQWTGSRYDIKSSSFGVELLIPVDEYQQNTRTAKYAFMFISLTFLSFFMIELLNKKLMHPIQYLLIGFALLVFYSLLLAVSEHLRFDYAFLISSIATISLISLYTFSVLKNRIQTGIIFLVLLLLYVYLYIVVQLQDHALLIGSIGLFFILSLVMYLTRNIDWFSNLNNANNI